MPLYEYQCRQCSDRFELIQKFSDAPLDRCGKCGGALQKLLSAAGLQFKGSGFYITDYARKGTGDKEKSGERKPEGTPAKSDGASTPPSGGSASPTPASTTTSSPTPSPTSSKDSSNKS
jgi:putative FmdB family regulatory protein